MLSKSNCYYGNSPLLYSPTVLVEPPIAPPLFLLFSIHFSYFKIMGRVKGPTQKKNKKKHTCPSKGKMGMQYIFFIFNVLHL